MGFDGSLSSGRAVAFAFEFARRTSAGLYLVHAKDRSERRAEPVTEEAIRGTEEALARGADAWRRRAMEQEVRFDEIYREESAADAILAVADEVGAQLIVVGTRGLGSMEKVVLGSVSSQVLARAKVPVTVVP